MLHGLLTTQRSIDDLASEHRAESYTISYHCKMIGEKIVSGDNKATFCSRHRKKIVHLSI